MNFIEEKNPQGSNIFKSFPLLEILNDSELFTDGDWVESKDQDPAGEVRLIQLADIGDGYFVNKSRRFLTHKKSIELRCSFLKPGDVLVARMPDPIGRACIFPGLPQECVTVVDVCIIRPNPKKVDSRFLMHAFNSPRIRRIMESQAIGATRQRISRGNLCKIEFPLPNLDEQKRISAILDKADLIKQKRRESLLIHKGIIKSAFIEMFGDPVVNSKKWPTVKLPELGTLDRGKSKHRPRNAPELFGGPYPFIQTGDVTNATTYLDRYNSTYSELGLRQSKIWPVGTLAITIAANIAHGSILKIEACFPDSVVGFIPNSKTNSEFIFSWLSFLQKNLEKNAPQAAQKNINLKILNDLDVILPPKEDQNKFKNFVLKADQLQKKFNDSLLESDRLLNALLNNYFSN